MIKIFVCFLCVNVFLTGCRSVNKAYDEPTSGTIYISVDESFEPVISEQIKIYESAYPAAHIIARYEPEAACFRDLEKDSTRLIIVSRGLNNEENNFYKEKLSFKVQWDILAYDAIDVIINNRCKDSLFTLQQLRSYLNGKDTEKLVVLDGKNATSTVRFLKDSLLKGGNFGKNVFAAGNSKAVVNYISADTNSIGFVGSSWVGDLDDTAQLNYQKKIRLSLVECPGCDAGVFAKPSQNTISAGEYPLIRPLYYILKENATGLGTGFVNHMNLEPGQLLFRRSYLVPAKMDFSVRKTLMQSNKNLLNKTQE